MKPAKNYIFTCQFHGDCKEYCCGNAEKVIGIRQDGRDEWRTPKAVYEAICRRWNVRPILDVCADGDNTQCAAYISKEVNALTCTWDEGPCWMNPPYSQPLMTQFIKKAIEQAELVGAVTLFLLPAWVDQTWYHDLIKQYPHEFWRGRIKFEPPVGIKPSTPRYGNIHGVIGPKAVPEINWMKA